MRYAENRDEQFECPLCETSLCYGASKDNRFTISLTEEEFLEYKEDKPVSDWVREESRLSCFDAVIARVHGGDDIQGTLVPSLEPPRFPFTTITPSSGWLIAEPEVDETKNESSYNTRSKNIFYMVSHDHVV